MVLHGLCGSARNMVSFARRLVKAHPRWQCVLVDLRAHGRSASAPPASGDAVRVAATEVLLLLSHLRLFPSCVVGHSLGGKACLSMLEQFAQRLPRPVQFFVLDSCPGPLNLSGASASSGSSSDTDPRHLIHCLESIQPLPHSKRELEHSLRKLNLSVNVASWLSSTARETKHSSLELGLDVDGVKALLDSYERADLWPVVEDPPEGSFIDFIIADSSLGTRWTSHDSARASSARARVHNVANASHWLHIEQPEAVLDCMHDALQPEVAAPS